MNIFNIPLWGIVSILIGCSTEQTVSNNHEHDDHGHHDDSEQVTVWTNSLEAFVEYDYFEPYKESTMLIHLTWLKEHRPVTEGELTVHLEGDGVHNSATVSEPTRRGIFIPTIKTSIVDNAQLWLELKSEGKTERINLATVSVQPKPHTHEHHDHDDGSNSKTISFLKEQAWDIPFQTVPVREEPIYQTIEALGQWTVRPEDWHTVSSPTNGIISFGSTIPHLGSQLQASEHVFTIQTDHLTDDSLSLRWNQIQVQWNTVRSEYQRNKPLMEQGILSKAQWEAIEHRYLSTKATYDKLEKNTDNGGSSIKNPLDGHVSNIYVASGDYVEQGTPLYQLVTKPPSLLHLSIPHRHHDALKYVQGVEVQIDEEWVVLPDITTNVGLSLGEHHTIPVQVFTEPQTHVTAEEKTPVRLKFGSPTPHLVIPTTALLEEYGQYSVIKQISGEEFVQQPVEIDQHNGTMVSILSGLQQGDWIVSKGNYVIKMVSESGSLPAHGHAH